MRMGTLGLILIGMGVFSRATLAASVVTATPASAHPGLAVTLAGAGFGASEAVDVYFDTTDTLLLVSSATGTLTGSIIVPTSAPPGAHSVTAIGRHSGDAAQVTLTVSTPWLQPAFGQAHLGWNPYENVLSTSTASALGSLWSAKVNSTGSTPVTLNNRLYLGTVTGVVALSATTGATLWTKTLNETFYASGALAGNRLYIGSYSSNFYSINTANGAVVWSVNFPASSFGSGVTSSAVLVGSTIYVANGSGIVYALQAATGAILWSYATGGSIDSSPAYADGAVYIGARDNKVYALDGGTGALLWTYATGGQVESSPAIANHVLYVGSDDAKVYAIGTGAADAGALRWTFTTGGAVFGNPVVANGLVYVGSVDANFYALNAHTGSLSWQQNAGSLIRSATVANGVVYFTSQDNTLYVDAAAYGASLATLDTGSNFLGQPAVVNGTVFVSTLQGVVYAYAPNAGADVPRAIGPPDPAALHPDLSLSVTR